MKNKTLSKGFGRCHLMGLVPNLEMELAFFSKSINMVYIHILSDWNSHVLIMKYNMRH
jgi:hypothetical protein